MPMTSKKFGEITRRLMLSLCRRRRVGPALDEDAGLFTLPERSAGCDIATACTPGTRGQPLEQVAVSAPSAPRRSGSARG